MSDEAVKARIRKLMAVAGDGVATEAEIETAMRLAAKLLDQHHLSESDIQPEEEAKDLQMGRSAAFARSSRFSQWESALGGAIIELFGCIKWYIDHEVVPVRKNGIAVMDGDEIRRARRVYFYGPAIESAEAAELFEEWSQTIATMGVARWGGCFRGDGAQYCNGFATALLNFAQKINRDRRLIQAKPIPQLESGGASTTAITLESRYEILRARAEKWVEEECGVHLQSRYARGSYTGNADAFRDGHSHGEKAGFGRKVARKMLPGGAA